MKLRLIQYIDCSNSNYENCRYYKEDMCRRTCCYYLALDVNSKIEREVESELIKNMEDKE